VSGLTFTVYNATNTTSAGTLASVVDGDFVDEFNSPGYGSVTVPVGTADAALLVKDAVVRVSYQSADRFAFVIETLERDLANPDGQQTITASGRGLLAAILDDAVVYPQGGLADFNTPDRPFNYASAPGDWRNSGNYQAALGVSWRNDTTARKGQPVRWKDASAQWIWRTDPTASVQTGTVNWFYRDFTLTASKRVRFYASADNLMTVYLDGNRVMSSSDFDKESPSFTQMAKFTTRLGVGTHTIAARVRNGAAWTRTDLEVDQSTDKIKAPNHGLANGTQVTVVDKDGAAGLTKGDTYYVRSRSDDDFKLATTNSDATIVNVTTKGTVDLRLKKDTTAGFILTGIELNDDGKELDSIVVRTGTAWSVSSTEPYWRPAMILRTLIEEAAARGVYRLGGITFGFDGTSPSSGSWTTEVDLTLKAGSSLLTVLDDMVDLGIDFWLNPSTMELEAWETRGTDKSGTVVLNIGTNLTAFTSQIEQSMKTVALVRTANGWLRAADNGLRTTNGWRETYLEYGSTASDDVARRQAQKHLARTGKTQVISTKVEVAPVTGALPYVDYTVGDVVAIPNPAGTGPAAKARILSIAMRPEGGGVQCSPEIEVITSA
jgi:hypothetical protein